MERYAGEIFRSAYHLQRFRDLELDVGSAGQDVLLAPLLFPSTGFEFRKPGRARSGRESLRLLARDGSGWIAPRCGALPLRTRRHQLRKFTRDPCLPEKVARACRPKISGPNVARGSKPV